MVAVGPSWPKSAEKAGISGSDSVGRIDASVIGVACQMPVLLLLLPLLALLLPLAAPLPPVPPQQPQLTWLKW